MSLPALPYPSFPLQPKPNGQWGKKIKQKPYYFGKWSDDPNGARALDEYNRRLPGILAGRDHLRSNAVLGDVTLGDLLGRFLGQCKVDVSAGKLSLATFGGYLDECSAFVQWAKAATPVASLRAEDFTAYHNDALIAGRKLRAKARKRVLAYVKRMFKWGSGNVSNCSLPSFGDGFKAPVTTEEALRVEKARLGLKDHSKRIVTGAEVDKLLAQSQPNFRAMILLGVNCGLGPADIGRLRWRHLDLDSGRLDFSRGKTGVERVSYLWKETRAALLATRETKHAKAAYEKDGGDALVFITRKRQPYYYEEPISKDGKIVGVMIRNSVSLTFSRLARRLKLAGVTYYRLRHTFKTLAKKAKDPDALNLMMGHRERTTGATYDHEDISLKRVRRVARIVRLRLWPELRRKAGSPGQPMMRLAAGDAEAA